MSSIINVFHSSEVKKMIDLFTYNNREQSKRRYDPKKHREHFTPLLDFIVTEPYNIYMVKFKNLGTSFVLCWRDRCKYIYKSWFQCKDSHYAGLRSR